MWGILQLAILGIGAGGVPLWAHHPMPRESIAFEEMVCGQTLVLSLMFPILIRSAWGLAFNLMALIPFEELSGLLSRTSEANIARGGGCVAIWMVGLAMWSWNLHFGRRQMWVVQAATLFTIGGVILDYVRWETNFANGQGNLFSPISLIPQLCHSVGLTAPSTWIEAGLPAITAIAMVFLTTLLPYRKNASKTA